MIDIFFNAAEVQWIIGPPGSFLRQCFKHPFIRVTQGVPSKNLPGRHHGWPKIADALIRITGVEIAQIRRITCPGGALLACGRRGFVRFGDTNHFDVDMFVGAKAQVGVRATERFDLDFDLEETAFRRIFRHFDVDVVPVNTPVLVVRPVGQETRKTDGVGILNALVGQQKKGGMKGNDQAQPR